jgi:putative transposase
MIKEQETGMPTAEVCYRHGLNTAMFYKLKGKYGGMEVSEATKLKRLLAVSMLRGATFERFEGAASQR